MTASVGLWEHFKKLADFKGREDRASFWPYAALVLGICVVGMFAVMIPAMAMSMRKMQQFAADHPDQVNVVSVPGQYSMTIQGNHPELGPDFSLMFAIVGIVILVTVLLYAAAVVRRLHDRGMSGLWGLMPVPFLVYSCIQMPRFSSSVGVGSQPDLTIFFSIFVSNMFYLAALVTLIVLLAGASNPDRNRFDLS
jgi:uncharacterized membrane protein YhaH (DUF805 family)